MEDNRTRYKTKCSECGHEFETAHSLLMEMGMNTGSCTCPECKTDLHLQIDIEKYKNNVYEMIVEPFSVHLEKIKKESSNKNVY